MTWYSRILIVIVLSLCLLAYGCTAFNRGGDSGINNPPPSQTESTVQQPTPTPTPTNPTSAPAPEGFRWISDVEDPTAVRHISLRGSVFRAEIAATPAEWTAGLAHRETLARNTGMLFVFPDESIRIFWMRGVLIPVDILYMDAAGVVVDIHTMIPEPGVPDSELRRYPSAAPIQYAFVLNAGFAQSHGFSVGDWAYFR